MYFLQGKTKIVAEEGHQKAKTDLEKKKLLMASRSKLLDENFSPNETCLTALKEQERAKSIIEERDKLAKSVCKNLCPSTKQRERVTSNDDADLRLKKVFTNQKH